MTKEQALSKAMKLCSSREYAPFDIDQKLGGWGIPDDEKEWVIAQLRNEKFIDDFRMARSYANDKLRFNKWGKIKIKILLQQKGIDSQAIEEALANLDLEEYKKILEEELNKKRKSIKDTDDYRIRAKLFNFGSGRGFESDLVYRMMDVVLGK